MLVAFSPLFGDNFFALKQFLTHPIFSILSETSKKTGIPAYVVGGYVRDCLLNRVSKDIDIVVLGNGIHFAEQAAASIYANLHVSVFKNF